MFLNPGPGRKERGRLDPVSQRLVIRARICTPATGRGQPMAAANSPQVGPSSLWVKT